MLIWIVSSPTRRKNKEILLHVIVFVREEQKFIGEIGDVGDNLDPKNTASKF